MRPVPPDNREPPELQARLDRAGRVDLQASPVKAVPLEPRELPDNPENPAQPDKRVKPAQPDNLDRQGRPEKREPPD